MSPVERMHIKLMSVCLDYPELDILTIGKFRLFTLALAEAALDESRSPGVSASDAAEVAPVVPNGNSGRTGERDTIHATGDSRGPGSAAQPPVPATPGTLGSGDSGYTTTNTDRETDLQEAAAGRPGPLSDPAAQAVKPDPSSERESLALYNGQGTQPGTTSTGTSTWRQIEWNVDFNIQPPPAVARAVLRDTMAATEEAAMAMAGEVTAADMAWAIEEAGKIDPHAKTRPLSEVIAERRDGLIAPTFDGPEVEREFQNSFAPESLVDPDEAAYLADEYPPELDRQSVDRAPDDNPMPDFLRRERK